jgi:hypothetical protein
LARKEKTRQLATGLSMRNAGISPLPAGVLG